MVINKIANEGLAECSCAGHSTRRAQHTGAWTASPITIVGLFIDLQRDNPLIRYQSP